MSQNVNIEHEMRKSYLEYSLSVIIGRAIPDVRDGLKPVHRRILFAQQELANSYNRPPKKCARIVGDVIGKYHPHGDSAVYNALVRLAQDFSMRDPLEDGQGNFGSIDGDAAAAMRYTEVRMSRLASEFLNDIDKETVDFRPNYDNTLAEPVVLPTKVPNLLLNGSSGIAVGMATNIPPHNLSELSDALLMLIDDPESSVEDLMDVVQGPDFPTGGYVYAGQGLYDAYTTGRGTVKVRGKVEIEDRKKGFQSLIIREIPFGLNKSSLVEKIAALINDRKIDGVSDLRDESDRRGIRVVIELKRGTMPEIVINSLYKYTPLETSFGINMLAVVDNRPVLLNLKTALTYFLDHRREVVVRRTKFELRKAEARAHILEGLLKALDHIDEVVSLIRSSATPPEAKERLMQRFELSEVQAQAILDMRLQRLTGLERGKIEEELRDLLSKIAWYQSILGDASVLWGVIRDEVEYIKQTYSTPRRTEVIREALSNIDIEDLLPDPLRQCSRHVLHLCKRKSRRESCAQFTTEIPGAEPCVVLHRPCRFKQPLVCGGQPYVLRNEPPREHLPGELPGNAVFPGVVQNEPAKRRQSGKPPVFPAKRLQLWVEAVQKPKERNVRITAPGNFLLRVKRVPRKLRVVRLQERRQQPAEHLLLALLPVLRERVNKAVQVAVGDIQEVVRREAAPLRNSLPGNRLRNSPQPVVDLGIGPAAVRAGAPAAVRKVAEGQRGDQPFQHLRHASGQRDTLYRGVLRDLLRGHVRIGSMPAEQLVKRYPKGIVVGFLKEQPAERLRRGVLRGHAGACNYYGATV